MIISVQRNFFISRLCKYIKLHSTLLYFQRLLEHICDIATISFVSLTTSIDKNHRIDSDQERPIFATCITFVEVLEESILTWIFDLIWNGIDARRLDTCIATRNRFSYVSEIFEAEGIFGSHILCSEHGQ